MSRDSVRTRQIQEAVAALAPQSPRVSSSQLERYAKEKLLPRGKPTPDEVAHHIVKARFAETYRPSVRNAADRAALFALYCGCWTERCPLVWAKFTGGPPQLRTPVDPETDEGSASMASEASAAVEHLDRGMPGMPEELKPLVEGVLGMVRDDYVEPAIIDYPTKKPVDPDICVADMFETVLGIIYGQAVYLNVDEQRAEILARPGRRVGGKLKWLLELPPVVVVPDKNVADGPPTIEEAICELFGKRPDPAQMIEGAQFMAHFLSSLPLPAYKDEITLGVAAGWGAPLGAVFLRLFAPWMSEFAFRQ